MEVQMDGQKLAQNLKTRGLLSFIHLIAGSSLVVRGIIVSVALAAGYGSVVYFHGKNAISEVAHEVVEQETGVDVDFNKPE